MDGNGKILIQMVLTLTKLINIKIDKKLYDFEKKSFPKKK